MGGQISCRSARRIVARLRTFKQNSPNLHLYDYSVQGANWDDICKVYIYIYISFYIYIYIFLYIIEYIGNAPESD